MKNQIKKIVVFTTIPKKVFLKYFKKDDFEIKVIEYEFETLFENYQIKIDEIKEFEPSFFFILEDHIFLRNIFYKIDENEKRKFFYKIVIKRYYDLYKEIQNIFRKPVFFSNIVLFNDQIYGNNSNKILLSFYNQIKRLNLSLMDLSQKNRLLYVNDIESLQLKYSYGKIFDNNKKILIKTPFTDFFLQKIVNNFYNFLRVFLGSKIKLIITDLDNTLWSGIVGELGPYRIEIGDHGIGEIFTEIQIYLKELKKRGIMLAIVSKNDEENVFEVFDKNNNMLLKKEDFIIIKSNWQDKAKNVRDILDIINVSEEDVMYIDDSVYERERIKKTFPDIHVIDLGDNPSDYLMNIIDKNLFDDINFSNYKTNNDSYIVNQKLQKETNKFLNEDEFLKSINMRIYIEKLSERTVPRATELFNKTNQFNVSFNRYNYEELFLVLNDNNKECYHYRLADKYTDYGIIAVCVIDKKKCIIENLCMSCRVFGRGVELFILNHLLFEVFKDEDVMLVYNKTKKNKNISNFLKETGFKFYKGNIYINNKDKRELKEVFIRRKNESI